MEIEWMMMQYNSRPPVSSLIPQWDQQKAKTHTRDTICHSDGAHSSSHCSSRVQQRQRQPNRPSLKIDTVMHVTNQMNRLWRLGSTPSSLQRKIWKNSFLFYFFRSLFDFLKKIPERGKGSYLLLLLSSSSSHPPPLHFGYLLLTGKAAEAVQQLCIESRWPMWRNHLDTFHACSSTAHRDGGKEKYLQDDKFSTKDEGRKKNCL